MPASRGSIRYRAELWWPSAVLPQRRLCSLPYCAQSSLNAWIGRQVKLRGQPYRVSIETYKLLTVDTTEF